MDQGSRGLSYAPNEAPSKSRLRLVREARLSQRGRRPRSSAATEAQGSARIARGVSGLHDEVQASGLLQTTESMLLKESQRRSLDPPAFCASTLPQAVSASGASSEKASTQRMAVSSLYNWCKAPCKATLSLYSSTHVTKRQLTILLPSVL